MLVQNKTMKNADLFQNFVVRDFEKNSDFWLLEDFEYSRPNI